MIAIILALVAVVGYLEAANQHGDAQGAQFWGGRPVPAEVIREVDRVGPPPVQRFGFRFDEVGRE